MRLPIVIVILLPLAACVPHVSGLLPVSPSPNDGRVDSLTPKLQWEPFPERDDPHVTDVVYDLRVMGDGGAEFYSRQGLTTCAHKMEQALVPGRTYLWTVRVRFRWEGRRRESQWSELIKPFGSASISASARVYFPLCAPTARDAK